MASLKDRIKSDLTEAMRARDEVRKGTLRMVLSAIGSAEVAGDTAKELSDDETVAVLTREVKRRREAAEAFRSGGREDSAEREEAEAAIVGEYLPAQLSDEELAELVDAAVTESGAESQRDMGKVMKVLQPKVAGRAEGRAVADAVKARLTS
ncbi:GatB/YqeY domain-containing protein [Phytoactinopolyspora endophytica]|uniref:GatB/YqeY domain-containing protein n=1 Tax=Phytoactinopolyspora endophytica TaxID=1642495 RepID=UPI00101CBE6C|nr:GatB/YqeY domain-containing protein [Phytoactinopolyspora endophytica]